MNFILDLIKQWGALVNYRVGRVILQNGTTLMYNKVGQVILQSIASILHYRAIYFTKWGKYCKAGQPLLHSGVVITKWAIISKHGCIRLRNKPSVVFPVLKTVLLNFCKILRKLPITESDFSNVADETLLKSLSVIDTFLEYTENLEITFLRNMSNGFKGFDLKSPL